MKQNKNKLISKLTSKEQKAKEKEEMRFLNEQIKDVKANKSKISESDEQFQSFQQKIEQSFAKKKIDLKEIWDVLQKFKESAFHKDSSKAEQIAKYNDLYAQNVIKIKQPYKKLGVEKAENIFHYLYNLVESDTNSSDYAFEGMKDIICYEYLISLLFNSEYPALQAMLYLKMGVVCTNLGQMNKALEYYKKTWELKDKYSQCPLSKTNEDTFNNALLGYSKGYKIAFNVLADEQMRLAEIKFDNKEYEEAQEFCKKALEYNPQSARAQALIDNLAVEQLCLARDAINKKNYKEAQEFGKKVLEYNPQSTIALALIAKAHLMLDEFKEGLDCINKIVEKDAQHPMILNMKAAILEEMMEYEESLACLNKALIQENITKGDELTSRFLKSMMFYHLGQYKEGLKLLSTIKNDYTDPDIYRLESLILIKLDSYEEALKSIETAIKKGLNNARTYASKALILSELNRESDAIELYKDQIKINCKNSSYFDGTGLTESDFYSNLGALYARSSNDYEALLCYEKALELNSSNLHVLNNLSTLLYQNDYFKEAEELLTKLSGNGGRNLIDLSFLALIKTKITQKTLDESYKEDDQEYISNSLNSLNLYNKIENLVLSCIDSSDEKIKQDYKSEINYIITKNPSLYKFVINLFSSADDQEKAIESLEGIFASDNPTLIHKFFQHKKELMDSSFKEKEKKQFQISDEIEGLHKINTGKNFKGEWFFKFTNDVYEIMGELLEKIKDRINDLHIVKETAQGKVGFKKHELKASKFHLLKLVGLGEDKEIYSSDMYKYYDSVGKKSYIFSSFNHIGGHQEMSEIINHGKDYNYTCHDVDNLGDFQSLLSSDDLFL